jgi:L-ascorbate metabolism protein UlaG (beta-lactamase superfamily)
MKSKKINSPNYNGKIFINPVPTTVTKPGTVWKALKNSFLNKTETTPKFKCGPFKVDLQKLNALPPDTLRVTWLGHSSSIIEIEGKRILTDPVYSKHASPFTFMGPERFFDIPIAIEDIPELSGIIISHDHYDHLDHDAVRELGKRGNNFFCPLGVGDRLASWGISKEKIHEFDWWDELDINGLKLIAAPARHFSGRTLLDRFKTLWASWIILGKTHSVYFGADSGMFPGFKEIGDKFGPFDLTMLEIGAYNQANWPDIHLGPENALEAHLDLKGKLLLPLHWGTFNLAFHPWKEPAEQIEELARNKNVSLIMPPPGEIIEVDQPFISKWWEQF